MGGGVKELRVEQEWGNKGGPHVLEEVDSGHMLAVTDSSASR